MGYNTGPTKRRRFDVPISAGQPSRKRRAVSRQHQRGGDGTKGALFDAGIVIVTTLATTVLLLAISGQVHDTTAGNLIPQSPAPLPERIIIAQPTPQPSLSTSLIAAATPSPQPNRFATTPSPEATTQILAGTPANTSDDTAIQAAIDKKLQDDPSLSALRITATVSNGKVILVGTAPTDEMKGQVEKLVRAIKGVKQIDNQIVVISNI